MRNNGLKDQEKLQNIIKTLVLLRFNVCHVINFYLVLFLIFITITFYLELVKILRIYELHQENCLIHFTLLFLFLR